MLSTQKCASVYTITHAHLTCELCPSKPISWKKLGRKSPDYLWPKTQYWIPNDCRHSGL